MIRFLRMLFNERGSAETTVTTVAEAIPTAVAAGLLELEEGDVIRPLVTEVGDFRDKPGYVHNTPFFQKLTGESDAELANQAIDSGDYQAASAATIAVHGTTVFLKELAVLASASELMAVAGQLIGQSLVTVRDKALAALFTSFTQNEGGANTDITPGDLFAAYNFLRKKNQKGPFNLVVYPGHIWGGVGLINMFANTADANHYSGALGGGVGTVGEDFMRNGFAGRIFGFDLYTDNNIVITSNNGSGAAFSRRGIKYVPKRDFQIVALYNGPEVGWQVTGSDIWGCAVLEDNAGDEMQFNPET